MSDSGTNKEDVPPDDETPPPPMFVPPGADVPPDDETSPPPMFVPPGAGTPVGVAGGICANCGGMIAYDNDSCCCVIIILCSVCCFPFGLISLCWMKRRPHCAPPSAVLLYGSYSLFTPMTDSIEKEPSAPPPPPQEHPGSPAITYEFDGCICCLLVCLFIFATPVVGFLFCLIAKKEARCMQCEPSAPPLPPQEKPVPREAAGGVADTASTEKEPSAPPLSPQEKPVHREAAGAVVVQTPPPAYYAGPPPVVMAPMPYGASCCMRCGSSAIDYEFDCGMTCLIIFFIIFGVGLLGLIVCLITKRDARCMQCGACGMTCNMPRAILY
ncbi:hypothetical protein PRIPAC_88080 [Pristionchus pacificus]|uniref:Uncharacterized protein n=1 Tax=Pristionchus pacificus TaxID=54126 RepID=A0A2A6CU25_PRIPA|nr:hypothetical protein PRIPAC_88080 [Pristionchus pacificus]|eukprot:PDM81543.1 hypothetical protein PRIPAC_35419 [Pristionchus pacificus]